MSGSIMHQRTSGLDLNRQDSIPNGNSPLKLFTEAKTKINEIFKSIELYVNASNKHLDDVVKSDRNLITNEKYCEHQRLKDKVNRILSIISRDHMKVVFFGRTSNGKSTTMNAMLRERILPTGMGHTTNCFLQIEGTDKAEPYMLVPGSDEPKSVNNLGSIGSALSRERLDSDSLVKILWPREKCRLIRDDVVLVDSPGIDVSANLDQWIENHCLDADVFVLVISAEATITVAEKKFLHNVAQRLSNPNIFILMNRWDATANEPEMVESVRQQHLDRGLEFLCDELRLCNREEAAEHRMFFISSREALLNRNTSKTSSPNTAFAEGYEQRLEEFKKFEQEFEECISKTAVQTKFQQHTNRGKEITNGLRETIDNITNKSQTSKEESVRKLQALDERNNQLERELRSLTEVTKEKIRRIADDVYRRVSQTLNDEIKRLYSLIEDFDRPFSSDVEQIPLYKRDLHRWVEERLGSNLQSRLNSALHSSLDTIQSEIKERVKTILVDPKRRSDIDSISSRPDFSVSYCLDCSHLCSDFREDIQFKFSLGLPTLWQRFVQTQKNSLIESKINGELPSTSSLLTTTSGLLTTANQISALSPTTGLIVFGVTATVWKSIGWKVVGVIAGIYGGMYLYERVLWTKKAQERAFKRQYADYASSKMKSIVNMTSDSASKQVQQELSMCFAQAMRYVDGERDDIEENMKQARTEIDQFLKFTHKGKELKKQGDRLDYELSEFSKRYLSSN